ncbi:PAS domain-containing protein [Pontibrevibacter nitratireducens]|uniref:histidine kinase n=1 Tax=Pontivivens nitratireducens TaxID=2758038 RepID=A0A6G7VNB6_9RHOB|nr:PAS domain-containing protein [Pontibrevibacter nitratireducens]
MPEALLNYESLFQQMSVPFAVLDHDRSYLAVNTCYTEMLMRSAEDLIGNNIFDLFPETLERRRRVDAAFRKALAGQTITLSEVSYPIPGLTADADTPSQLYWNVHCSPVHVADGRVIGFGLRVENVSEVVHARQVKDAIEHELRHRVSNLFAMVSTIARRTAANHRDIDSFLHGFLARIQALATTNSLLTGDNWDGMTVQALLERQLGGFMSDAGQIEMHGPEIHLSASDAQLLSMAIHELATNAAKYGAISDTAGHLTVDWQFTPQGGYFIDWLEEDLSNIRPEKRAGFGTSLLTRILPNQLNGEVQQDFGPDSHHFRLTVSAPRKA